MWCSKCSIFWIIASSFRSAGEWDGPGFGVLCMGDKAVMVRGVSDCEMFLFFEMLFYCQFIGQYVSEVIVC